MRILWTHMETHKIHINSEGRIVVDKDKNTYTQREWDRTVGWGYVPEEYRTPELTEEEQSDINKNTDKKNSSVRSS